MLKVKQQASNDKLLSDSILSVVAQHPPKCTKPQYSRSNSKNCSKNELQHVLFFLCSWDINVLDSICLRAGKKWPAAPHFVCDTFYKTHQPQQVSTNSSLFTSDARQANPEELCIKSRNTSSPQTSPCKPRPLFQKKLLYILYMSWLSQTKVLGSVLLYRINTVYFRCFHWCMHFWT